jgi:hypothetical protein
VKAGFEKMNIEHRITINDFRSCRYRMEKRTVPHERTAEGQTALFLLAEKALKNQRKQNSV